MSIGELFSKAYELWKRDVLWLILAAFVVGIIMFAIILVAGLIVVAIGGAAFGLSSGSDTVTGLSAGVIVLGVIIYIVAMFLVAAIGLAFYGGVFEMVIGAAKDNRPVVFGDLFSGFRKFSSYLIFALVLAGIGIGFLILSVTIIGIPIAIVLAIWISVLWLYVLPLIADKGMTFGEAAGASRAMVKSVGWWKTFGLIILLEVAIWVVLFIVQLITSPFGSDPESAGYVIRNIIYAIVAGRRRALLHLLHQRDVPELRRRHPAGHRRRPAPPVGGYAVPPAPPAPPQAPVTPATPVTPAAPVTPPVTPETAAPPAPPAPPAAGAATAVTAAADPGGRRRRRGQDGRSRRRGRGQDRGRRRGRAGGPRSARHASRGSAGAEQSAAASAAHLRPAQPALTRTGRGCDRSPGPFLRLPARYAVARKGRGTGAGGRREYAPAGCRPRGR